MCKSLQPGSFHIKNEVSLEAVKVTPKRNIKSMSPTKRDCYFDYEHPPSHPLTVHKKYSQVGMQIGFANIVNAKILDAGFVHSGMQDK